MIELRKVTKIYRAGGERVYGVRDISLTVPKEEFVVIVGPSGCGKSTLLNLIGGIDTPTEGKIIVDGEVISDLSDRALTNFRRYKVGFVFQFFNLISSLTALENVELSLQLRGIKGNRAREEAIQYLDLVGVSELGDRFPSELSGGEQQRVAIALGLILSIPLGFWLLSFIMNYFAVSTLGIPSQFITYKLDLAYVGYAAIFAVIFSIVGAFFPSYRAASFTPAEAMRPYIASRRGTRVMSQSPLSPTKRLIFRDIFGHRARSLSTIAAIALVLSLGLAFALSMSSFKEGIKQRFDKNELWDIRVSFTAPQSSSTLNTWIEFTASRASSHVMGMVPRYPIRARTWSYS